MKKAKKHLTTGNIAQYCDVDINTVKNWIKTGILESFKTPSGHFRIPLTNFKHFVEKNNFPYDPVFFGEGVHLSEVLIVDDDEAHNRLLKQMIKSYDKNLRIQEAFDGFEGYHKFMSEMPKIMFLDIKMPVMTGIELLKKIHSRTDIETKVFVISGHVDDKMNMELQSLGAVEILEKPIHVDSIKNILNRSAEYLYE